MQNILCQKGSGRLRKIEHEATQTIILNNAQITHTQKNESYNVYLKSITK